jgi:hypothetical protein
LIFTFVTVDIPDAIDLGSRRDTAFHGEFHLDLQAYQGRASVSGAGRELLHCLLSVNRHDRFRNGPVHRLARIDGPKGCRADIGTDALEFAFQFRILKGAAANFCRLTHTQRWYIRGVNFRHAYEVIQVC